MDGDMEQSPLDSRVNTSYMDLIGSLPLTTVQRAMTRNPCKLSASTPQRHSLCLAETN
jgi:hypothetical protein